MDFAKKQLEKYGWSEGKGLGKNEDGINTALKPKLKFDNSGLGHNLGEQFTNRWWENLYNTAAQNLDIQGNKVKSSSKERLAQIEKCLPLGRSTDYKNLSGSFLKTAKLTESGIENYNVRAYVEPSPSKRFEALTDEELFAACGGRTAHKGARHGLKLSGKLSRIEKQEEMLLRKLKKVSLSDESETTKKKLKKIKKKKEETETKIVPDESMQASGSSSPSIKKNKHKKRKSVSFNETVTKIYTVELDTSFDSEVGSLRDENSNEPLNVDSSNGSDEGIEQDLENNNNDQDDDHRSFEMAQFNYNDLSKAERKKLKKKRKLEARKETSTMLFLEEANIECSSMMDWTIKKRKCEFEDTNGLESKRSQSTSDFPDRYKSKKNKRKRKKQKDLESKEFKSITKALNKICRISDDE